jgi:hypothetical protein
MSTSEPVEISFEELVRETPAAFLLKMEEGIFGEKVWFPKSQCTLDEETKTIEVPEWLAIEKGLV